MKTIARSGVIIAGSGMRFLCRPQGGGKKTGGWLPPTPGVNQPDLACNVGEESNPILSCSSTSSFIEPQAGLGKPYELGVIRMAVQDLRPRPPSIVHWAFPARRRRPGRRCERRGRTRGPKAKRAARNPGAPPPLIVM